MGRFYFTCSFDDGDIYDLRLAELMDKCGVKGTFYIPQSCSLVSQSLSGDQIRELSNSFEIGGHTISHQILTKISYEKAKDEITNCKKWLEDITGKQIRCFCPPTGRFNREHILLQKKAGFMLMRTVEMLACSLQDIKQTGQFVILPTTIQVYNHTYFSYCKNFSKRLNFGNIPILIRVFNGNWEEMSKNYIAFLNEMDKNDTDYYFHLWGHSWEVERNSLWNSLERFFKNLHDIKGIKFCNNSELAGIFRSKNNL